MINETIKIPLPATEKSPLSTAYSLPIVIAVTGHRALPAKAENSYPYINLGIFLCAHCHILLAIWDGKESDKLGGTAQVVKFHHSNKMNGLMSTSTASLPLQADDESDLIFHIACPLEADEKQPEPPLDWNWWTQRNTRIESIQRNILCSIPM